jgi:hypothetical protein
MTTPTASTETERLLELWRELEAERDRRFKEKLDAGEAIRVRCILDEHGDETEAQARAIAALPEKGSYQESGVDSPDHYSADCRCDIAATRCAARSCRADFAFSCRAARPEVLHAATRV